MIFQSEAAECGLACLTMMLCYFGNQRSLASIRSEISASLKGWSLSQLITAAQRLGLTGRPVSLSIDEVAELKLPCILHWDMNHLVVIESINRKSYTIYDPAKGICKISKNELSKHFTGIALELTPSINFEQVSSPKKVSIFSLLGKVFGLKRVLLQIGILSIGIEILLLLSPMYIQWMVDNAITSNDKNLIHLLAILFAGISFIQVLTTTLRSWVILNFGTSLSVQWSINVFSHMMRLPINFFEKRNLGDITSRFDSLESIQSTLSRVFIEALIDAIMVIAIFYMMLLYSGLLTSIALGVAIIYALLRSMAFYPLRQATQEMIYLGAKQETTFLESIRAIQAIKLFGQEIKRQTIWHNRLIETTNRMLKTERFMIGYQLAHGLLSGLERIVVIWIGAQLILSEEFTIGMLFAFFSYATVFSIRTAALIDNVFELHMLSLHTERLSDIVLTPRETISKGLIDSIDIEKDIEIKNLSFRYSDLDPYIIQDVNISIKSGSSVALIGPSGCGKTTLAKLILGLLPPTEGAIFIGGVDISKVDIRQYRNHVNAVMQDDQLLAGSIAENICFFDDAPDHEKIIKAARLASIEADIVRMPMSYQTLVGDMGSSLSGGQKQRILLARALYRNPKLIILDEATSHLDINLEKAVNSAIKNLQVTRIVIAHRPETIASCDYIIDLASINKLFLK